MELPDFLTRTPDGDIRLAGRRVGLYHLVLDYRNGLSPEMIALEYAPLPLATAYKAIAFYLDNRAEVDEYVRRTAADLDRQSAAGRHHDADALRRRLAARPAPPAGG